MLLTGWKNIANHLKCGVRSAQRWEVEFGLPVRRPAGGDRHLVFAFSEELDEWVRQVEPAKLQYTQPGISLQAELRKQLAELRIRQRQLMAELRASMHSSKLKQAARLDGHGLASSQAQAAKQPSPNVSRGAVLAVDDNESQLYAVSRILRHAGFTVFEACTAKQALEIAIRETPLLALLDIRLPDLNGYDLFAMLRQEARTRNMPVLFYTAAVPTEAAEYVSGSLRAEGLLPYPMDPKQLVCMVQGVIDRANESGGPTADGDRSRAT
jgi:CheY-like chemotaxis protein